MRTKLLVSIITLCTLPMFMSCEEKSETPVLVPDGEALNDLATESIEERTQTVTVDATDGGNVVGEQGTVLQFSANAFQTLSGDPVTGDVTIKFIEVYDRSAMLFTRKPTTGKMDNGDHAMLISGGEFYVNATQGGNQLKPVAGYYIIAPTDNTGDADHDMKVFTGVENCIGDDCENLWVEEKDRGMEVGQFQGTGGVFSAYYCYQKQFGWTNIDKWYSDPRPKTTIFVDAPEGFDNTNCAIFLSYDDEPTALALFDTYDEETGLFSEHYGLIPIGLKVHFILVSIVDDEIHYAIQGAEIIENHVEVIGELKSITKEELIELIGNLP